jgi:hypothetical protein
MKQQEQVKLLSVGGKVKSGPKKKPSKLSRTEDWNKPFQGSY